MSAKPTGKACAALPDSDTAAQQAMLTGYDVVCLAFEIADSAARSDVECYSGVVEIGDVRWYDLAKISLEERTFIENALRYMLLRGEALPYRVICHPEFPFLRRFEPR